ncbi:MAG: ABC transporter ATP-binding protein [Burkholderiaceae bacterium]
MSALPEAATRFDAPIDMQLPLSIRGLTKHYDSKPVLDALDLDVPAGTVLGLLGRNGSGKSTLMECALGLRGATAGQARIYGADALALTDDVRARIGYVPQDSNTFEWLTAGQLLDYFASFYPRWNREKVHALMQRWGIEPGKSIGKLSGGQKQRLSIIRALAPDPELLVLDEPVAALDPAGRRDFLRELVDSVERGTTIIFSTHILTDLERIALDVAFLRGGKIALQAPLDALTDSTRKITGPATVLQGKLPGTLLSQQVLPGGQISALVQIDERSEAQCAALAVQGVRTERVGLEDLFVELTQ